MQVTETLAEGLKHEFKVSVPASDIDAKVDARLVDMKDKVKLNGSIGIGAGSLSFNPTAAAPVGLGSFTVPIQGQIEVEPRPGTITSVTVDKKSFKGDATRVTVKDVHIKVDNCVGASSLRSYAVLTSSGTDADDIVAYYGVAKVF